jgi:hypothetical protein
MVLTESTPGVDVEDPVLETGEERERFWEEVCLPSWHSTSTHCDFVQLVKEREIERETAIAEGKMDDPTVARQDCWDLHRHVSTRRGIEGRGRTIFSSGKKWAS